MTTPTLPSTPVTPIRGAAAPLAPASNSPCVSVYPGASAGPGDMGGMY